MSWKYHKHVCKTFQQLHESDSIVDMMSVAISPALGIAAARGAFNDLHDREPNPQEMEQISRFPRCNVCAKSPIKVYCEICRSIGWCSKLCQAKDEHHSADVCGRLTLTTLAAPILQKEGGSPGMCGEYTDKYLNLFGTKAAVEPWKEIQKAAEEMRAVFYVFFMH